MNLQPSEFLRNSATSFLFLNLMIVVLLTSCGDAQDQGNTQQESANTEEAKTDTQKTGLTAGSVAPVPPTFLGKLAVYNTLFSNSDCSHKLIISPTTGPINCTTFADGLKLFEIQYTSNSKLSLAPSIIKLNKKLKNVIKDAADGGHYGLVFHYGYMAGQVDDSLVYLMSRGQIYGENDLISYCPLVRPDGTEYYYLMATDDGLSSNEVDHNTFSSYTSAYASNVKRNGNTLSTANKDPLMVYHRAGEFQKLLAANSNKNATHLYIGHGSLPYTNANNARHIPCFALGTNKVFSVINNKPENPANRFEEKALDVGRQCPPNCPSTVLQCLQPALQNKEL